MIDSLQTLRELLRADTSNPPGNEMRALTVLTSLLEGTGAQVAVQPLANGLRGNLVARLPGTNPKHPPLVLLSHVDVVPAHSAEWRFPPFEAMQEDGFLYGRGAVDTKQLTVMELAAFLALDGEKTLTRDVYFVATGDEECGSELGLKHLLQSSVTLGTQTVRGCDIFRNAQVISEGGGFPVMAGGKALYLIETGQKGCAQVAFRFREPGGVYLTGTGAPRCAAALVEAIHELTPETRVLPTLQKFEAVMCQAFGCQPQALPAQLSPLMASILQAMRVNTLTPTLVKGNGLQEVTVICDARLLPGCGLAELEAVTLPLAQQFGAEMQIVSFSEGYESAPDETVQLLGECLLAELPPEDADAQPVPFLSMGSSDGRFLQPLGASVYGFSPVLKQDMTFEQAVRMVHGVNERIHRDSLAFGCRVVTRAVRRMAGVE